MQISMEQIRVVRIGGRALNFRAPIFLIRAPAAVAKNRMRQGGSHDAVMLHLRDCYVSKAAILTVPARPVPVENRSPA